MAPKFTPLTIPLGRGLDQAAAKNIVGGAQGLRIGRNLDFGLRGGVTGRPGAVRANSFNQRTITNGVFGTSQGNTLTALGYTTPCMITVRDGTGTERPGLVTRGRMYSYEDTQWMDRLGICQAKSRRVCDLLEVGVPDITSTTTSDSGCATYDFGPSQNAVAATTAKTAALLGDAGGVVFRSALTETMTMGNGARCGEYTAVVHTPPGTNKLMLVTRNTASSTVTEYTLATDARDVNNRGDAPCVCCDYDETALFIAYYQTGGSGTIAIKRVTVSTGAITHSTTFATGLTVQGLWLTNTAVATNRLVVAVAGGNGGIGIVKTRVLSSSALANQTIDLDIYTGQTVDNSGQVVVGSAENGQVWCSWINDDGKWYIGKRSITAATLVFSRYWKGRTPPTFNGTGPNQEGAVFYIQHQPITVGGRVLIGLSTVRASGVSATGTAATWTIHDITNLWTGGAAAETSSLRDPVAVAKGESYRSMAAWGPSAAVLSAVGSATYRFPSVDWQTLRFASIGDIPQGPSDGVITTGGSLFGERGIFGLNEISLDNFQVAHFKESTLVAGSVPRSMARGYACPVGFPWLEAPTLTVQPISTILPAVADGTVPEGSYTFVAVWAWVDEAGQVHRSEPSFPVTTVVTAATMRINVAIGVPHFNERETGIVYIELYSTDVNPADGDPHFFRKRYPYAGQTTETVGEMFSTPTELIEGGVPIYTDGAVLEAQVPNASGGIVTVGNRCWVSDGLSVFASRLGEEDDREAPSWYVDGALTVTVPPVAGRVIGLSNLDDKLIVLCERGIYYTGGVGPDDTNQGGVFEPLQKAPGDLGVAHQRSITSTPKGVIFQSANYKADGRAGTGGLWLLDRSLTCGIISTRTQDE